MSVTLEGLERFSRGRGEGLEVGMICEIQGHLRGLWWEMILISGFSRNLTEEDIEVGGTLKIHG